VPPKDPSPDREELETAFIGAVGALRREMRRVYDRELAPAGLSLAHAHPLVLIAEHPTMSQRELAERLEIEGPTLVRLLHQLGAMGLVKREQNPHDHRANTLHLTAAGRATAKRLRRAMDAVRARLLAGVSDDELADALRVFDAVRRSMTSGGVAAVAADG
jgi:MarR family transcriptional regulator, transcriptional regulator for hemolysin